MDQHMQLCFKAVGAFCSCKQHEQPPHALALLACRSHFGLVPPHSPGCIRACRLPGRPACLLCLLVCPPARLPAPLQCSTTVNPNDTCEQCNGDIFRCSSCGPAEFLTPARFCQFVSGWSWCEPWGRSWAAWPSGHTCRGMGVDGATLVGVN